MLDLLSGITICFDSFIRRELWKPHLTEDIHNVSIVEIAYVSLVGIMVLVDGFNIYITWQALHRGIFRRRSIISKEMRAHLKSAPLRVNRSSGKAKKHNKKRDKQKLVV